MKPTVYNVGEGARLVAIRTDRFKSELLTVQLAVPITKETAQHNALLFELLRRGTQRYPTKALFHRHLDELYATNITPFNRRAGDMQVLGISADFLGERFVEGEGLLPRVVSLMAELLYHPYFPEGHFHTPYVESEKRNLVNAIRSAINNPRAYARDKCRALLCEGEPYALPLIGTEDSVGAITPETLTAAWQQILAEVKPTFFYVGNSDPVQVAALLTASFDTARGSDPRYVCTSRMPERLARVDERVPLCQGKLAMGYRSDVTLSHPLSAATVYVNEIFGGSAASKLFLNVRERRGLCYHCASSLDLFKGTIFVGSGIKVSNRTVTEEAIMAEFDAICRGEISETEFFAARRAIDNGFRQMYDNPGALFGFYMGRTLTGDAETVESRRETLANVTLDEVVEAANRVRLGAVFFLEGTQEGDEDE